jgi:hypothetical protein
MRNLSVLSLLVGLLAGCPTKPVVCTTEARGSVNLTVVDEAGAPIDGAVVTYTVVGSDAVPCDDTGDGQWVCGWEVDGGLTIDVSAPGYQAERTTVEVDLDADQCHVIPQDKTVILVAEYTTCTSQPNSAQVTVVGASGEALTGVSVRWGFSETDGLPRDCVEKPDLTWTCAEDQSGMINLYAVADGHGEEVTSVELQAEGPCDPDIEAVLLTLDWLPD